MDPKYDHKQFEESIYSKWEDAGVFSPKEGAKPFTVLMPPPNANASLHAGHAMYTVDDILVRWKRMQGFSSLWIPGMDHAGFETQYVYEKNLAKEGKSRLDFDSKTLYKNVFDFVKENSGLIYQQFKRLGFSADWSRSVFTLDDHVIDRVYETFSKMHKGGLVYKDDYIVNYCTHCGTSLAELEVIHITQVEPLYYLKYGPFTLATVRPETKFGDTAVAVHPDDARYTEWIGKEIEVQGLLGKFKLKVIADTYVDPEFGTGVVKITPAHDPNDFAVWGRHKDEMPSPIQVIGIDGKLTEVAGKYAGLRVKKAREIISADLEAAGLIEKIDKNYEHSVSSCYKCKNTLEPLIVPNWFIKVDSLKKRVIEAVEKDEIKFHPKKFKRHMLSWLTIMHDWPISRQIVWGIRIPVWYSIEENPDLNVTFLSKGEIVTGKISELLNKYTIEEIEAGLQKLIAPKNATFVISKVKPDGDYLPETDTFDTWFSSGQWPLVTLADSEFSERFPTDVMGTLSDILKFWISRMIMFSLYLKDTIPFKDVYLWAMVADAKGVKMSKSKGNVINPLDLVEKYGADALRMSLIYGTPAGSKVILSEEKVRGMRNFANKIWNIARFVESARMDAREIGDEQAESSENVDDAWIKEELVKTIKLATTSLERFKLNDALEAIYEFIWHKFADIYIEKCKDRRAQAYPTLDYVLKTSLALLHPFAPFVTEATWSASEGKGLLATASWPEVR